MNICFPENYYRRMKAFRQEAFASRRRSSTGAWTESWYKLCPCFGKVEVSD